jgi:outer membrane receptor for ferrienterochelin and colicins
MNKRNPLLPILPARAPLFWHFLCVLWLLAVSARADNSANNSTNQTQDLTELSLEELMQIKVPEVYSASKFEQKATEAPSSVTVISSDEIKRYGYRTLGDILASVQGFYVSYDRNYDFLGARGVNLGDFNSRILLLIDGHRINNDLNDGAYVDTAFLLDVDLIDRVEIIRGPGSVLYGNNAFFGVINVITRQGKQINGVEVSGMYGSYNAYSGRVTIGDQLTNGLQFLLSGTIYHDDGPENLFYPQFDTPTLNVNNGIAHNMDGDGFGSFFGSVNYKDFTVEGGYINREKTNPTGQFSEPPFTTFDDPRLQTVDDRSYATLKYAHNFSDTLDLSGDVYYDRNDYQIGYPLSEVIGGVPVSDFSVEHETGEWAGGEVQVNKKIFNRHILTFGAEYRNDFVQKDQSFDETMGTLVSRQGKRQNYGFFGQGDFLILTNLHLNAGVRYDQYGDFNPSVSPRAALIYDPFQQSTFKFIYGTAFRDPNFLELSDPRFHDIHPEKINSYELVYEQGIGRHLRSSVSGYYNRMDDLIDFQNGYYTNFNADTLGLELALQGKWENGIITRLSYTLQHTENRDTDAGLPDSPMHLIKFNASVPLWRDKIFAGLEVQYTSKSHTVYEAFPQTPAGADVPGYAVVNFTLFSQNLIKNLDISASVYNLLDKTYYDPSSGFHLQSAIQQDGRTFRIKLTYRF